MTKTEVAAVAAVERLVSKLVKMEAAVVATG